MWNVVEQAELADLRTRILFEKDVVAKLRNGVKESIQGSRQRREAVFDMALRQARLDGLKEAWLIVTGKAFA